MKSCNAGNLRVIARSKQVFAKMVMSVTLQGENVTSNKGGGPWSDWKGGCCLLSARMGREGGVAAEGLLESELAGSWILLAEDSFPSKCIIWGQRISLSGGEMGRVKHIRGLKYC